MAKARKKWHRTKKGKRAKKISCKRPGDKSSTGDKKIQEDKKNEGASAISKKTRKSKKHVGANTVRKRAGKIGSTGELALTVGDLGRREEIGNSFIDNWF